MARIKKGKITPNGVSLEKHENETVVFFTELGYDIELIPPSHIPNTKSADFKMGGKIWETKSPVTYGKASFEHIFRKASKQSCNIIYDLRRLPQKYEQTYIAKLKKASAINKIKILIIITISGHLLTVKGKFGNIKP